MTIRTGDRAPSVTLTHMTADEPADLSTEELFGGPSTGLPKVPNASKSYY